MQQKETPGFSPGRRSFIFRLRQPHVDNDLIYQVIPNTMYYIFICMKVRPKLLANKARIEILDTLYTTAGAVRGRSAMKLFLRDLLTPSERIMLGRRIMIARKLISGRTHRDIEADMKVGKDTVWRVQKWLDDQSKGYERAVTKLERELDARHFTRRKSKYPPIFAFLKDWSN